jgi:hypothetical protein
LRLSIIERELVEKTNESISLKTQMELLKIQLEEIEDITEDKMEAYSNNKNKDLIKVRIRIYLRNYLNGKGRETNWTWQNDNTNKKLRPKGTRSIESQYD